MEIIITQWALDSYLDLKHTGVFSMQEYQHIIKPDVLRLKQYPTDIHFKNNKFWSVASEPNGKIINNGYKMKWHQMGNGRVQLRLPITMLGDALLCEGYQKVNEKLEKRKLAKFKTHIELIQLGLYATRGILT